MKETDELLKGSTLTEEVMLKILGELSLYCDDMHVENRVIPALKEVPLPTLVAVMEADEQGRPRILNISFLPLDKEDAEFTVFLQFYMELSNPVSELDRATLLECACRLNERLPLGHCVLSAAQPELKQPQKLALRSVQGFPAGRKIDQGVFTEDVFLFDLSCDLVSQTLDALNKGKTLDEALTPPAPEE